MKKFFQVLGAIIYTYIFSNVLYLITVIPLSALAVWFVSLSTFWKIIFILFVPGASIGFILLCIQAIAFAPYAKLLNDNIAATVFSIGVLLINVIRYVVMVWSETTSNLGGWAVVINILATVVLVIVAFRSVAGMLMIHGQSE